MPEATTTCLLIVDDEADIRSLIKRYFRKLGFCVVAAGSGVEMEQMLVKQPVDIVLLDVCLPDISGIDLLPRIKQHYRAAVIMLTAQAKTEQRIAGLNLGADDYLPKPFDLAELHARINAVLRRNEHSTDKQIELKQYQFDNFTLDTRTRRLFNGNYEIRLSPAEYDLLLVLLKTPNTVLDRDYLMLTTRGRPASAHDRAIDVRMGQLRKKLSLETQNKALFSTVRGGGYMLDCDVQVS